MKVCDLVMAVLAIFGVLSMIAEIIGAVLCWHMFNPWNIVLVSLLSMLVSLIFVSVSVAYYGFKPYPHLHHWRYDFEFEGHFARTCLICHEHQVSWTFSLSEFPSYVSPMDGLGCERYMDDIKYGIRSAPMLAAKQEQQRELDRKFRLQRENEKKKCNYKPRKV